MKTSNGLLKLTALLLLFLQLSGCTGFSKVSGTAQAPLSYSQLELLTDGERPAAVQQLILQGRMAWQEGDIDTGLVALDRALRISPDDGLIYYYLAAIRKEQGEFQQSASLAKRGLSLAYNQELRRHLQALLASSP